MKIDQYNNGAAVTVTAGAALQYVIDQWYAYCTGANITGQQVTVSGQKRYKLTGLASNTGVGFGQRIEADDSVDLAGCIATLQAKLSSTSLTSITWTAYYANTTDTFGTLASPTRTQIATGTFTINSTEKIYSTPISIPTGATTGIEIVLSGGALIGSQTLTIGDVQLELGSMVGSFENRRKQAEMALCQRFYRTGANGISLPSGASCAIGISFELPMRAAPTVTRTGQYISGSEAGTTVGAITTSGFIFSNTNTAAGGAWKAQATL